MNLDIELKNTHGSNRPGPHLTYLTKINFDYTLFRSKYFQWHLCTFRKFICCGNYWNLVYWWNDGTNSKARARSVRIQNLVLFYRSDLVSGMDSTKFKVKNYAAYVVQLRILNTSQPKVRPHFNLNQSETINCYKKSYNLI